MIPNMTWQEGQIKDYYNMLLGLNDGNMDVNAFIATEYGEAFRNMLNIRFAIERDEQAQDAWFDSLGLGVRRFETEDYFTRWLLLFPKDWENSGRREALPLVFYMHGGGIPIDEELSMTGFPETAGRAVPFAAELPCPICQVFFRTVPAADPVRPCCLFPDRCPPGIGQFGLIARVANVPVLCRNHPGYFSEQHHDRSLRFVNCSIYESYPKSKPTPHLSPREK